MNKLGFGYLRLPMNGEEIDLPAATALADRFLAAGGRYFDTAYTYLDGKSEWALRETVVKRYPRSAFQIADKLPSFRAKTLSDCRRIFEEQLERVGVDFFDVYLLHGLNEENYRIAEKVGQFGFIQGLKTAGKVVRTGFSYHDTPELLDEILTAHPELDVVQLQINYLDWDSESIQSHRCYEVALKHGKPVIVMEPVKGGGLANIPEAAKALLAQIDPDHSPAHTAIRFPQGLAGVETVLSGMNTMAQLEENLLDAPALTEEETKILARAAVIISSATLAPCTGCGYCLSGCPQKIYIPKVLRLLNEYHRNQWEAFKIQPVYDSLLSKHGRAGDCIGCRQCEHSCPQKLEITGFLRQASAVFDQEGEA